MNMKFLLSVLVLLVVANLARGRKRNKRPNNKSCYTIKNTWWKGREEAIEAAFSGIRIVEWDAKCSQWNNDPEACSERESVQRASYASGMGISVSTLAKVPCTQLGAHTNLCVSNPCNNLNNGACTLEETMGLCVWNTKKHEKKFGSDVAPFGCYRNPCHIGGEGITPDAVCAARSTSHRTCTFCKGSTDRKLRGLGMGCQMVNAKTKAACAPINSGVRAPSSIMQIRGKKKCQCSLENALCTTIVDERSVSSNAQDVYVPRFPDDL